MTEHLWMPHSGPAQPFHVQIANQVHVDEDGRPLAYSVGPCFYIPDPDPGARTGSSSPTT